MPMDHVVYKAAQELVHQATRRNASAGGKANAAKHQAKYAEWQRVASEIWARKPELSKFAVAELVRKQHGVKQSAKHIARNIARP
jgi:hypothetical protein